MSRSATTTPISHQMMKKVRLRILSAINVGAIKLEELPELWQLSVRGLDELIDYQRYPVRGLEISTKARRSLGIGYIGLAHFLAKNKVKYGDAEAHKLVHELTESFQYNLLKHQTNLQKKKVNVSGLIEQNMQKVNYLLIHIKKMLTKLQNQYIKKTGIN